MSVKKCSSPEAIKNQWFSIQSVTKNCAISNKIKNKRCKMSSSITTYLVLVGPLR